MTPLTLSDRTVSYDDLAKMLHAAVESYCGTIDDLIEARARKIVDDIVERRVTTLLGERQRETIETLTKLLAVLTVK